MKKYSIILLAVLLLFSFVSCKDSGNTEDVAAEYEKKITEEQTKRESIIKNYEGFLLAKNFAEKGLWTAYKSAITDGMDDKTINYENDTPLNSVTVDAVSYFVSLADGETASGGAKLTAKSGSVEVKDVGSTGPGAGAFYYNKDLKFTNVEVAVEYTVKKADGTTEEKTANVTLSGTFSVTNSSNSIEFEINMTAGDKTYNATWTFDTSKSPWKYTAATANGADVEMRLLAQTNTPAFG